jgi:hypothetical protein
MAEIRLTKGYVAIVDDDNFDRLNAFSWNTNITKCGLVYACRGVQQPKGSTPKRKSVFMHHDVIGRPPIGVVVDHDDGNGLNNKVENLKFCTQSFNTFKQKTRNSILGIRGVYRVRNRFRVLIQYKGKRYDLGYYQSVEEAAEAQNSAFVEIMSDPGAQWWKFLGR